MPQEIVAPDTVLAVDFGSAHTRALLFDVVHSQYRLVGYGQAASTVEPPYQDAREGWRYAMQELQAVTGRAIMDDSARLVMPATSDGRGVDLFVATCSAGQPVRTVLVGLLPGASLASLERALAGHYLEVRERLSLGDSRAEDEQIDALIAAHPELLLVAGGTDGGASQALARLIETIGLSCHLLPPEVRPRAIYAGNANVAPEMVDVLGRVSTVTTAPNVLPELHAERLEPMRAELDQAMGDLRLARIGGLADVALWTAAPVASTAQAAGHLVRFLSKLPAWPRGVLHADVGSRSTSLTAAFSGRLSLSLQPDLGVGVSAVNLLTPAERGIVAAGSAAPELRTPGSRSAVAANGNGRGPAPRQLVQVAAWLPFAMEPDQLREYILAKGLHPHTVPADERELAIEHALARHALRRGLRLARPGWPARLPGPGPGLMPWLSLLIGGGAAIASAPTPGQAALMLLDALQPVGVMRLLLDPLHLAPALGAAASVAPLVTAQVHDSLAFLDLGTVVCLAGRPRSGDVAVQVQLVPEGDSDRKQPWLDVRGGSLAVLPLPMGSLARLNVRPRGGLNAGFGPGRARSLNVLGGALGVLIDARGRPLRLPRAAEQRHKTLAAWAAAVEAK
jgi:hypothetical protein